MSRATVRIEAGFDLEGFLAQPLVARVAAAAHGNWSRLPSTLKGDPRVALVVDTCDLETGEVLQVAAAGDGEIYQLDPERARRILRRYLGADESRWPERFTVRTLHNPATRMIRVQPSSLRARSLSYEPVP